MKNIFASILLFIIATISNAQTPVVMSSLPNYTYTENFNDINNWVLSTAPANGTFTAGIGASAWKGIDATTSSPSIPNANRITTLSNFFQIPPTGAGGFSSGFYKENGSIALLSTGTTDNTSSIAIDFFLDFTGLNAGNLSFNWASINNSTGNRRSSLRVYASIDGINFTEITNAQVLNFTNNSPTSGTISNVALPSIFNNAATARLRFYYHNGTGGTTGSRPRLGLDDITVTAVPTTPCITPLQQAINFSTTSVLHNAITINFNNPPTPPNNYLVIMSLNPVLTSLPVNGVTYALGDNIGDGNVIAITNNNTVTATNLDLSTTYYFFIFSVNNSCTGGPLYLTTNPLTGNATTTAGPQPCTPPANQPTNLTFTNVTTNSISGSFTAPAGADEYLVIRSLSSNFTGTLNNGTTYNGGNVLGNGTVVTRTAGTTFTANNLASGTTYFFFIFSINNQNCTGGAAYNTVNPLTSGTSTVSLPVCAAPNQLPTQLNLVASNNLINGLFNSSADADGYLIVRTTANTLSATPVNNSNYNVGNSLGNGTVIQNSNALSFIDYDLTPSTTYYYHIFARNTNCTGGTKYNTTPLVASATTTAIATNNWYYGNLHAHSSYSDGNQDNPSFTPANNYAYAKNSLCMDFLGISDHNHAQAGMNKNNWPLGLAQANAATTNNFLAFYGMEWGVISNGGHVLVYGTNQLIGWENNNHDIFVAQSNYTGTPESNGTTGLFRTINNLGGNVFATLAHPAFSDFNNLSNLPYNATADSAIVGTAVASGIAFSTNTTYNDPPSSYSYLDYYNRMLSKGYKLAPQMDHDNHNTNFGRSNNNRTVVIAPDISSNSFFSAMKNRTFYATEDCDTRVWFTINNQQMGSILNGNTPPSISVYAYDPTNPSFVPTIRIFSTFSGDGITPTQLTSSTGYTLNFTDYNLVNNKQALYYADITIAGNRTITAPIWYTRNAIVPLQFTDFSGNIKNNVTYLTFTTANEINCSHFIIEKSNDGKNFESFYHINAHNNSKNIYNVKYEQPFMGNNYYRIKLINKDQSFSYSNILFIQNNGAWVVNLSPNPTHNNTALQLFNTTNNNAEIGIYSSNGILIQKINTVLRQGNQTILLPIEKLKQGVYTIVLRTKEQQITRQVLKY
jgi:hypothetical protein